MSQVMGPSSIGGCSSLNRTKLIESKTTTFPGKGEGGTVQKLTFGKYRKKIVDKSQPVNQI